jgi:hypothetical protein
VRGMVCVVWWGEGKGYRFLYLMRFVLLCYCLKLGRSIDDTFLIASLVHAKDIKEVG